MVKKGKMTAADNIFVFLKRNQKKNYSLGSSKK